MMERTQREYGGFLPLELNKGKEYYQYANTQMQRFNCAKAAVDNVLGYIDTYKIYVPYYLCPNVCKEIEHHNIEVCYYYINNNLLPELLPDEQGICIYLVNYFGVMDKAIAEYARNFEKAWVIIDNCHSFFEKPIMGKRFFNVYSCKKFFGVPDGAYLIGEDIAVGDTKEVYADEKAGYLLECLEHGTNYCYARKKNVDHAIAEKYEGMSVLAQRILMSIDYDAVKYRRHENFYLYEEAFATSNILTCEKESTPYMYPLNVGKNIKKQLVDQKIYVPTLWDSTLKEQFKEKLEYRLADETIFLPVDQRYEKNDIQYIIEVIFNILKDNKC